MVEADREGLDGKAVLMVGMIVSVGSGSVGFGPNAASSGNLALSPQAARNNAIDPAMNDLAVTLTDVSHSIEPKAMCQLFIINYCVESCRLREKR